MGDTRKTYNNYCDNAGTDQIEIEVVCTCIITIFIVHFSVISH
jgi:hypothetical protein